MAISVTLLLEVADLLVHGSVTGPSLTLVIKTTANFVTPYTNE